MSTWFSFPFISISATDTSNYYIYDSVFFRLTSEGDFISNRSLNGKFIRDMLVTSQGSVVFVGAKTPEGKDYSDLWFAQISSEGMFEWEYTYGYDLNDYGVSLLSTSYGYALMGVTYSQDMCDDFWFLQTDEDGRLLTNYTYGGTSTDTVTKAIQTSEGDYVLTGWTASFANSSEAIWIIKVAENGSLLWQYIKDGYSIDRAYALVETVSHDYIVVGTFTKARTWIAKLSAAGTIVWETILDRGGYHHSMISTSDGGCVVATQATSHDSSDLFVFRVSESGVIEWNRKFDFHGRTSEMASDMIQTVDGNFVICGNLKSYETEESDSIVVKFDPFGNLLWQKSLELIGYDTSSCLVELTDSTLLLGGKRAFLVPYSNFTNMIKLITSIQYINTFFSPSWFLFNFLLLILILISRRKLRRLNI